MVKISKPTVKKKVTFKTTPGASSSERESVRIKNIGVRAFNVAGTRGRTATAQREAQQKAIREAEATRQKAIQLEQIRARQKAVQQVAQEKQRIFELGIKLRRAQAQRRTRILTDRKTNDRLRVTTVIDNKTKERIVVTQNLTTGAITTKTFERRKGIRGVQATGKLTSSPITQIKNTLNEKVQDGQRVFGLNKLIDKLDRNIQTIRAIPFDKRGPKFQAQLLGSVGAKSIAETNKLFNDVRNGIISVIKDKKVRDKLLASVEKNLNPKKLIGKIQEPGFITSTGRVIKSGAVSTVKVVDSGIEFTKKHPDEAIVIIGTEVALAVVGGLVLKGTGKVARLAKLDKLVKTKKGKLFLKENGTLESVRIKGSVETKLSPKKIKILKNTVLADRSRKVDQFTSAAVDVLERRAGRKFDDAARKSAQIAIRNQIIKRLKVRGIDVIKTQAIVPLKDIPLKTRALAKLNRRIDKITQAFAKKKKSKADRKKAKEALRQKTTILSTIERQSLLPQINRLSKRLTKEFERRGGKPLFQAELERKEAEFKRIILSQLEKKKIPIETVREILLPKTKITRRVLLKAERFFKLQKIVRGSRALTEKLSVGKKTLKGPSKSKAARKKAKEALRRKTTILSTVERKSLLPQINRLSKRLAKEAERRGGKPLFQAELERKEAEFKIKILNELTKRKIPIETVQEILVPKTKITRKVLLKAERFFKLQKIVRGSKALTKKLKVGKKTLKSKKTRKLPKGKVSLTTVERKSLLPKINSLAERLAKESIRRENLRLGIKRDTLFGVIDETKRFKKLLLSQLKKRNIPLEVVRQIKLPPLTLKKKAFSKLNRLLKVDRIKSKGLDIKEKASDVRAAFKNRKEILAKIKRARVAKRLAKRLAKGKVSLTSVERKSLLPKINSLAERLAKESIRRENLKIGVRPKGAFAVIDETKRFKKFILAEFKKRNIPVEVVRQITQPSLTLKKKAFNKLNRLFKVDRIKSKGLDLQEKLRVGKKTLKRKKKVFEKRRKARPFILSINDNVEKFTNRLGRFVRSKSDRKLSFSDEIDLRNELNKIVKQRLLDKDKKISFDKLKTILNRGQVKIKIKNIEIKKIVNLKQVKPLKTKDGKIQLRLDKPGTPKDGRRVVLVGGKTQQILIKKTKKLKIKKFKQIQRQAKKSQLKFKQKAKQLQFKQKTKLRKSLRLVPLFKKGAKVTQANIFKSASDTAQKIDTITETITEKGSTLALRNELKKAQRTRQILLKLKLTVTKKKELLAKFKKKKKTKTKPKAFKKGQGFNVLARPTKKRKGQKRSGLIRINKRPLSQKDAKDLRNFILDTSLSRSGRIKPTKGKPKKGRIKVPSSFSSKTKNKFRSFRTVRGKRIPLVRGGVIEKRTKLLDTKQERANISLRKRISQLTKKKVKRTVKKNPTPKKPSDSDVARRRQLLANLEKARRVKASIARSQRRASTATASLTTRRRIISII